MGSEAKKRGNALFKLSLINIFSAVSMTVEVENQQIVNPLYRDLSKNQRDYADEMRKFASLCGLTIDSRLKVGTVQTSQISEEIAGEFGEI